MSEASRDTGTKTDQPSRRRFAAGLPNRDDRELGGSLASLLLHGLLIMLLFLPVAQPNILDLEQKGAGGPGPAGGGGGGHRGTGGVQAEHLRFVVSAPAPAPTPAPVIPPPVIEKKPEPVVTPPPVPTPPEPVKADTSTKVATTAADVSSKVAGVGGGSGNDGTDGNGPGRGGGVGSGVGKGRGSSVGDGTGGGLGRVYGASVTTLVILPIPVPAKIKPYEMKACFEVDSTGKQTLLQWTKSKDEGYNRKVEQSLRGYRFRPAVRLDGTPVRDTACVTARGS